MLEDADSTAKSILALKLLGYHASPDSMLATFDNGTHFKTYAAERNPSFSANCNILITLLWEQSPRKYMNEIVKALKFLCGLWYRGRVKDKWVSQCHVIAAKS